MNKYIDLILNLVSYSLKYKYVFEIQNIILKSIVYLYQIKAQIN